MPRKILGTLICISLIISYIPTIVAANQPPGRPDQPVGPAEIIVGEENTFSASATDPDEDDIKYGWDWDGDYNVDVWTDFIPFDTAIETVHIYLTRGSFEIRVKAKDTYGSESEWSDPLNVRIAILGDVNDDGVISEDDINAFVAAQNGESYFYSAYPNGAYFAADINRDGSVDMGDVNPFHRLYEEATNKPPERPSKPLGPTDGEVGEDLTYSTSCYDPDENQIYLKWNWGDETSGWLGLYNSDNTVGASHSWSESGKYDVKVKAKDTYDAESDWSNVLSVNITESSSELYRFTITSPSNIIEEYIFNVTVEDKTTGNTVIDADVTFNQETIQTDENGQVTLTAPQVNQDTVYTITVSKEGYQAAIASITVLNEVEFIPKGWIFGTVIDSFGATIEGANICVIVSDYKKNCVFTDDEGRYNFLLPTGTYNLEASKINYISVTKTLDVTENGAIQVDFLLQESIEPISTDENEALVESTIQNAISRGIITGKISVSEDQENPSIELYSNEYQIETLQTTGIVAFIVSAEEGAPGTFFLTYIGNELVTDSSIKITFDGVEISKMSIQNLLHPENNDEVGYVLLLTSGGIYAAIYVPSFSEHTIIISSTVEELVEILSQPIAILIYIIICLVGVVAFVYPYLTWPARVRKGKKF